MLAFRRLCLIRQDDLPSVVRAKPASRGDCLFDGAIAVLGLLQLGVPTRIKKPQANSGCCC